MTASIRVSMSPTKKTSEMYARASGIEMIPKALWATFQAPSSWTVHGRRSPVYRLNGSLGDMMPTKMMTAETIDEANSPLPAIRHPDRPCFDKEPERSDQSDQQDIEQRDYLETPPIALAVEGDREKRQVPIQNRQGGNQ